MVSLAAANAEFCFDLFKEMNTNQGTGNVFFSPLSLFIALSLVRMGSRGDCAKQIDKVLHFHTDQGSSNSGGLQSQMKTLLSEINTSSNDYQLKIANGLFAEKIFDFQENFLKCAGSLYNAKIQRVDFTADVGKTRDEINQWMENQTNGKIKDICPVGTISSSAVMVLVNAVYFKGKWDGAFTKSETITCRFKSSKCPGKTVNLMHQERKFNMTIINDPDMQVLELKYVGGISMYILLPENSLSEVENKLTYQNLMNWTSPKRMKLQSVEVFIPRIRIEETYQIKRYLKTLGMTYAFDESKADLSGIASGGRLYLSKMLHKSYIDITEDGTEAASATGNVIVEKQLPDSALFRADHPFLFIIRKNDIILFAGKVLCP
ncbi:serpin B7 [Sarcophilus harrisii]|uniref:Serpin B7 n=1 Tax=Sarcophilus harrisii TaxID=9305 RepID=G3X1R0_SARHA|nr:serpin B7 [Sarcophilus harrisii]XP_031802044.1 serpin B7 [Sarcophilus harrisii]